MDAKNVSATVEDGLCISCGICKSVCPKDCIVYKRESGLFLPVIEQEKCINCGRCLKSCPGYACDYTDTYDNSIDIYPLNIFTGNYIECKNCYAKNDSIRNNGVSGGVTTALIKECLQRKLYDCAFIVNTHDFSEQILTDLIVEGTQLTEETQKSRYVPVSHENTIKYILENRNKRVIIVGTPCAVQGILKVIYSNALIRDNYLLIGLFCDKTMNYNVLQYFEDNFAHRKHVKNLFFRHKGKGKSQRGWPGDVCLELIDGNICWINKRERMRIKPLFCPERCLYCIDKLNMFSDISVGDNYTTHELSYKDANSVIVRTELGKSIFELTKDALIYSDVSIDEIVVSQRIIEKRKNYLYSMVKNEEGLRYPHKINEIHDDMIDTSDYDETKDEYKLFLKKLRQGEHYNRNKLRLRIKRQLSSMKSKLKK